MKNNCSILTLKTKNYGGILQALALQKTISKMGYNVVTVDLIINKRKKKFPKSIITFFYQNFYLKVFGDKLRQRRTKCFLLQNLKLTTTYKESNVHNFFEKSNPDYVVIGSDQVWNDKMFNTSNVFFFPFEKKCTLISYAASFGYDLSKGNSPLPNHLENLRKFDCVSVREKDACAFLINQNIPATTVLDPTFLLTKDEWIEFAKTSEIDKSSDEYGLVYVMPGDEKMISYMRKVASIYSEKYKTKFYVVGLKDIDSRHKKAEDIFGIGPAEWLHLFIHARWVITNSFHGTVFSLIFNKDFVSAVNTRSTVNYPGRIINLLTEFNSLDNLIDFNEDYLPETLTNKSNYSGILASQVRDSLKWLDDSLKNGGLKNE